VTGQYIYCIIGSGRPESFGPGGIGAQGEELTTVCRQDIAAVVSRSPMIKYALSRDNMIAHEKAKTEENEQSSASSVTSLDGSGIEKQ